jgi:hypothetical protein
MNIVDIFNDDAFSLLSMTNAIERVYAPSSAILTSGLFTQVPINTPAAVIDMKERHFNIIPLQNRGEPIPRRTFTKGAKMLLDTYRIGIGDKAMAHELQFLLQFGTTDEMIKAAQVWLAQRQKALITDHDATLEHMYLGALDGKLIDHDGTVVIDWFTEFNLTRNPVVDLPLATASDGALRQLLESTIVRPMRRKAAGAKFSYVRAFCGDEAWDKLGTNPEMRESFKVQQAGQALRDPTLGQSLNFAGIVWENYVSDSEGKLKIAPDEVRFIPAGADNTVFQDVVAPGETFADVGTFGKPIYSRVIPDDKRDSYVEYEVMSYRAAYCTRPELLISGALV